jgi:hypothetical protein
MSRPVPSDPSLRWDDGLDGRRLSDAPSSSPRRRGSSAPRAGLARIERQELASRLRGNDEGGGGGAAMMAAGWATPISTTFVHLHHLRHSREGGNPNGAGSQRRSFATLRRDIGQCGNRTGRCWIPACAGMTKVPHSPRWGGMTVRHAPSLAISLPATCSQRSG